MSDIPGILTAAAAFLTAAAGLWKAIQAGRTAKKAHALAASHAAALHGDAHPYPPQPGA